LFLKQLVTVLFSSIWAFAFSYAMLRIIDIFTPVEVEVKTEEIGLDESIHGEHAYESFAVEELFQGDRKLYEEHKEEAEVTGAHK
jgi:ammonia channel protein AmtB